MLFSETVAAYCEKHMEEEKKEKYSVSRMQI
jgi:hypothetical protein